MSTSAHLRTSLEGAACHVAWLWALVALDCAEVEWSLWSMLVVVAVAVGSTLLADLWRLPSAVGSTWFVLTIAHHYLVGIEPRAFGTEVSGTGHVIWDLVFHLPPLVLVAVELRSRAPQPRSHLQVRSH